jgi:Domain of unknown function (DUF5665)
MSDANPNAELVAELQALRREITHLNGHDFVKHLNSPWRQMMHNFLRGLLFGLGSVLGGTVVVAFLLYVLAHVDFIPIVGEWAARITDIIQNRN